MDGAHLPGPQQAAAGPGRAVLRRRALAAGIHLLLPLPPAAVPEPAKLPRPQQRPHPQVLQRRPALRAEATAAAAQDGQQELPRRQRAGEDVHLHVRPVHHAAPGAGDARVPLPRRGRRRLAGPRRRRRRRRAGLHRRRRPEGRRRRRHELLPHREEADGRHLPIGVGAAGARAVRRPPPGRLRRPGHHGPPREQGLQRARLLSCSCMPNLTTERASDSEITRDASP